MKSGGNVSVVCRVRPFNAKEKEMIKVAEASNDPRNRETCVDFNPLDKTVINVFTPNEKMDKDPFEKHNFNLDYVFECGTDQATVYNVAAKPIVQGPTSIITCDKIGILEGFNGTVLAYGQTSSGKTFTMQGDLESETMRGIIPRMVETIFDCISQSSQTVEFTVKAAMLEIYNEHIRDLLDPSKDNLNVHEDKQKGIYVESLTEVSMGNEFDVYELMKTGNGNRAIAETKMNAQSSRSHSIFVLTLTMNDSENFTCKTGKLYLVDLAGSEIISKTGASGQTLEEAKGINKSLTMLGRVITALTDGKSSHIPYRDSKLTRILQDSLGGNSKTCLIITASPSMYNAAETLSTCRFGVRAKSIKNNAKVNKQVTLAELKAVITKLEKELSVKGKHISRLEDFLISKGLTLESLEGNIIEGDEPERLTTDESAEGRDSEPMTTPAKDLKGEVKGDATTPSPPKTSVGTPSPSREDATFASSIGTGGDEDRKANMEPAAVMKMYNQMDQQRDMIEKPIQEKKQEEQERDLDTLINQLRQERKKTRVKDEKLKALRAKLDACASDAEKARGETSDLTQKLHEKEQLIESLQQTSVSEKGGEPPAKLLIDEPTNRPVLVASLLEGLAIDPKIREQIVERASHLTESTSVSMVGTEGEHPSWELEKTELVKLNTKLKFDVSELNTRLNKEREFVKKQLENNVRFGAIMGVEHRATEEEDHGAGEEHGAAEQAVLRPHKQDGGDEAGTAVQEWAAGAEEPEGRGVREAGRQAQGGLQVPQDAERGPQGCHLGERSQG